MITTTFTQFRNNAASYFDKVEKGEAVEIFRNGKPSAVLMPFEGKKKTPREHWKDSSPIIDLGKDIATRMLLEDRRKGR